MKRIISSALVFITIGTSVLLFAPKSEAVVWCTGQDKETPGCTPPKPKK